MLPNVCLRQFPTDNSHLTPCITTVIRYGTSLPITVHKHFINVVFHHKTFVKKPILKYISQQIPE